MKKPVATRLRRSQALLELADKNSRDTHVRWRSKDLGRWETLNPRWWVQGEKIHFQFRGQGSGPGLWVDSAKAKPWGVRIFLSSARNPVPEAFDAAWQERAADSAATDAQQLWKTVCYWLRCKFPAHQIMSSSKRLDLGRSLSGSFLRVLFRYRGKDGLLVAADRDIGEAAHLALSQSLLWLASLAAKKRIKAAPMIHILVPSGNSAMLVHRCQHLNDNRAKITVWEYKKGNTDLPEIRRATTPDVPEEDRDFRWPVLGPFRWSSQLEQVLNLAPDLIRRYPRFQDYDSLRLWGLEFAKVMGPARDRICFGVGSLRTDLTEDNFDCLQTLVQEILYYRRPDSPDTQHPYYRLQGERWLEALILEDIPRLFPELAAESVYSQIPVYLGNDPGRIDILGADRQGTLVVMELKVAADPDLPVQALDYWGRVIQHNQNGDFERRGYFSEVLLNRQHPKIYLISPVFSYHDSTEQLLRYLAPDLEVWKISVNEDWRCGVKVMRRIRYRCSDLG
jgi:hypothetical protein